MSDPTGATGEPTREPTHDHPYFWITGASVQELYRRLTLADPNTCKVQVRIREEHMYLRVVPIVRDTPEAVPTNAPVTEPDINDSFLCPPICGG